MLVNIEKVKQFIAEPNQELFLRPLLLFRGGVTPGRAKTVYNFLRTAMLAEVPTMTELKKLSMGHHDVAHFCGFHAKYGMDRMGMSGMFSRLLLSPTILKGTPGLEDYLYWVVENTPNCTLYPLERISETSAWSKHSWRRVAGPRKAHVAPMMEMYPFISSQPNEDHALLLAVDAIVPKAFANDTRADICQDMIVAVLTGEVSIDNLRDAAPKYIKQFFKQMPSKYGHLSLDAPRGDGDNRTLGEAIAAEYR